MRVYTIIHRKEYKHFTHAGTIARETLDVQLAIIPIFCSFPSPTIIQTQTESEHIV